jgi:CO dehydrogenase/acetyl-CoA synthase alpha subunit
MTRAERTIENYEKTILLAILVAAVIGAMNIQAITKHSSTTKTAQTCTKCDTKNCGASCPAALLPESR